MLEARHITFAYGAASKGASGSAPMLADVSLTVGTGERLAITGPSGVGKTTLCRILAGYIMPQAGEVLIDGAPLARRGVCPVQLVGQHPETVLDPLLTIRDSLAECGNFDASPLAPLPDLLCDIGVRVEWLGRYPAELSGGELQRICIARALLVNPRYLIADEITTMLDAVTQARIWRILLREAEARNMGLVIVTHSPALTERLATRVFPMLDA